LSGVNVLQQFRTNRKKINWTIACAEKENLMSHRENAESLWDTGAGMGLSGASFWVSYNCI
jgi:hypothetical protein